MDRLDAWTRRRVCAARARPGAAQGAVDPEPRPGPDVSKDGVFEPDVFE